MTGLRVKIYQLATGEHVVCYRDPASQKRKRQKFSTRVDAKKHRASIELQYQAKGPQSLNETPLANYMKLHLEQYPNSRVRDRKNHFESFCKEFGKRPLNQIGKTELSLWFQKIKTDNDLSDRTLNTVKSDINTFFHYLEDEGVITSNPLQKIRFDRKPPPRRPRVVLSVDEVHKVLDGAKTFSPKILHPILFIAAYTGCRRGEVLKLKRKDVDFETGLIHFRQTKNGEDRAIRLSRSLRVFLEEFLANHDSEFVVPYKDGGQVPMFIIGKHLRRFRKLFPIGKSWGPHSLRHSFAFNFLKKAGNMYQLQAILGHKSIDVTVDTYGQIGAQDVENACPYEDEKESK
jgi:integrase/recombinase XerD